MVKKNPATGVNLSQSEFVYDGSSRLRISREYSWDVGAGAWTLIAGSEKRRVYNGMDVIQERDATDAVTTTYTRAGNIGGILSKRDANGNDYYFRYDGSGNVVGLTDSNQNSVAEYSYDAWGNTLSSTGVQASSNLYRYSTKELQPQTGLYNYGLRFYSAGMGRWINRDPLQEAGGLNLYAAFGNSPVNAVDAYGLSPASVAGAFIEGFMVGAVVGYVAAMLITAAMGIVTCAFPELAAFIEMGGVLLGAVGVAAALQELEDIFKADLCPDERSYRLGRLIGGFIGAMKGAKAGGKLTETRCFVAGTLVAMADGSHKRIEEIKAGDEVLSRSDKDAGSKVESKKVKQTFVHYVKKTLVLTLKDGSQVETTGSHRFWVDGHGWHKAKTFGIGTSIVTRAGPSSEIVRIEEKKHQKLVAVYNFEVEDHHTYFVGSSELWAHNQTIKLYRGVSESHVRFEAAAAGRELPSNSAYDYSITT